MVERAWYASVTYDNGCRAEVWRSTQDEAWGWVQRQAEHHVLLSSAVMDADRRAKSLAEMRAVHREADDLARDDWSPVHWFVDRLLDEDRHQRPHVWSGRGPQESTAVKHVLVMRTISGLQECRIPPRSVEVIVFETFIEPREIWALPVSEDLVEQHAALRRSAEADPAWWRQIEQSATAVARSATGGTAWLSVAEWLHQHGYPLTSVRTSES